MPRAVVLHIGFHKTGTSTIQAFLRRHRKMLMPHLAIRLKGQMTQMLQGTRAYSTWRDPISLEKTRRRFGALLDGLPGMPRRVLCLSAEELSGHMPGRGEITDYSAALDLIPLYFEEIAERFPSTPVTAYIGTRAAEPWLRSAWGEHVKSSDMTLDFDDFAEAFYRAADLDAMADQIADALQGRVTWHRLEHTAALPLGPVSPLLDLCEIPANVQAQMVAEPAQNTAPDASMLAALLELNRTLTDPTKRRAAKSAILGTGETP